MNDVQLSTLEQIREFLAGTAEVAFTPVCEDTARCRFVSAVRVRVAMRRWDVATRADAWQYLMRTTGYSRAQVARLLLCFRTGPLVQRYVAPKAGFRRRYTAQDVSSARTLQFHPHRLGAPGAARTTSKARITSMRSIASPS